MFLVICVASSWRSSRESCQVKTKTICAHQAELKRHNFLTLQSFEKPNPCSVPSAQIAPAPFSPHSRSQNKQKFGFYSDAEAPTPAGRQFVQQPEQARVHFVYRHCWSKHIGRLLVSALEPDAPRAPGTLCLCSPCGGKIAREGRIKRRRENE